MGENSHKDGSSEGDELLRRMLKTLPQKQEKKRDAAEATPRPKSQEKSQKRG